MPERTVTEGVRHLLKMACLTDVDQVKFIMDRLVPIFQQARDEAVAAHPDERWQRHVEPDSQPDGTLTMQCAECNGSGRQPRATHACLKCDGRGEIPVAQPSRITGPITVESTPREPGPLDSLAAAALPATVTCPVCKGNRTVILPGSTEPVLCRRCDGMGDVALVDCNRCGGTGVFRTPSMRAPCEKCKGSGKVPA